jgi:signal transduction histidine kinase
LSLADYDLKKKCDIINDEETRRYVFDPFFTTKEVGDGTGLSLSVSHTIICDKHQGRMWVDSEPGRGAIFIIELPLNG